MCFAAPRGTHGGASTYPLIDMDIDMDGRVAGPYRGEWHRPQTLEMCWDGDWAHGVYGFILVRREDVKM